MNEPNNLGEFVRLLRNEEIVNQLIALVAEKSSGTISVCVPQRAGERKKNLHLFIEAGKELNSNEEIALTGLIKEKLGYDYTADEGSDICVGFLRLRSKEISEGLYVDTVLLSSENLDKRVIENFLGTHYPHFFHVTAGNKKASSNEGSPRKIELNEMLATFEEFKKTASPEEVEQFSKAVIADVQGQKLIK